MITSDYWLLETFLYILRNPQKAGICHALSYRWSSAAEFGHAGGLTDSSDIFRQISENDTLRDLLERQDIKHFFLEETPLRNNDERVADFITSYFHLQTSLDVNKLPRAQRNTILTVLAEMGVSTRQICRVTGVTRGAVEGVREKKTWQN